MIQDSRTAAIRPRRVLVVGGGSAGLVTLRNLVERGAFDRVELVERRDDVGGIWYQDDPETPLTNESALNKPQWPSPAYPGLIGNVLPRFLSFSEKPFPPTPDHPHQPFPTVLETYKYLKDFATPYINKGLVRLNTEVLRVEELPQRKGWKVRIRDWSLCEDNEGMPLDTEEVWDAVAICAGYYDKPNWPDTEGLDVVRKRGLALHSKWWNGPDGYEGKRAIIIGNANSSNDIATQLAPVAKGPVYRSMRRPTASWFPHLPDSRIENVGPIKRYILQPASPTEEEEEEQGGTVNDKVTVVLQDGSEITDIDVVILGTGYCPHPEFVHVLPIDGSGSDESQTNPNPNSNPNSNSNSNSNSNPNTVSIMSYVNPALPQTRRVPFLYRHILYAYNPSLAFVGAILAITPFILSDVVSTWLTFAWAGTTPYPASVPSRLAFDQARIAEVEQMLRDEQQQQQQQDEAREYDPEPPSSFVTYGFLGGGEADYANELRGDVVSARKELDGVMPVWDEEAVKARWEMFPTKYEALKWAQIHCV